MNEDWRAGDLAVCEISRIQWSRESPQNPDKGDLLRVSRVYEDISWDGKVTAYFLDFVGKTMGWECRAFRKVRPEAKAADAEFTATIRSVRPRKRETEPTA
jgi:hypothetical protein